jgi:hypothetical protein
VEGGRVSSAAKDLRSLGQWFGFGLACDGWVGVVGGLLLGLVEGGIASNKSMSDEAGRQAERRLDVSVARARRCLQTARQRRKVLVDVQAPVRVRTGQDAASSKC